MGDVIRTARWNQSRPRAGKRRSEAGRKLGWFPIALVALPLATFTAIVVFPATNSAPAEAVAAADISAQTDREEAYFPICSGPRRTTCVVDGDTIWYRGEKIRLVGFDTPEVSNPGCANEARLGAQATLALQDWLNAGPFTLEPNPNGRNRDRYGRALLVVSRGGEIVAKVMLDKGLAERRSGSRNLWC